MSNVKMKYPGFLDKALTLSYDDGTTADEKMIAILDKYGIKCTFNINTQCYGPDGVTYSEGKWGRMSKEKAYSVYKDCGHEIALHTLMHQWMPNLPAVDVIREVLEDKQNIEETFGTVVRGMAYPYGATNSEICDILKYCGIVYSRSTMQTENFNIPAKEQWLNLPTTCHHKNSKLMQIADRFLNTSYCNPWLFYLWGHSYEFERDNEWDLLENFCKTVGNRDDIWYATNIEVFDYITAYYSLCFSAAMTRVYNPTSTDVYFSLRGSNYCVKPGQTLELK